MVDGSGVRLTMVGMALGAAVAVPVGDAETAVGGASVDEAAWVGTVVGVVVGGRAEGWLGSVGAAAGGAGGGGAVVGEACVQAASAHSMRNIPMKTTSIDFRIFSYMAA